MTRAAELASNKLPSWTTSTRPTTPLMGQLGYNSTTRLPEYYSPLNGGQWVAYNSSPVTSLRYLVIGGGGAGGYYVHGQGGGGAGGFLENSAKVVNVGQTFSVVVGAGGSTGAGNHSYFGQAVAYGGGGTSENGGCGGGGGHSSPANPGGNPTQTSNDGGTGYGFKGGAHRYSNPYPCGGGGGAGGAGVDGNTSNKHGNGGPGRISNITGSDVYYAGGGGAGGFSSFGAGTGTAGIGGGGTGGGSYSNGTAGTANTGGGGGAGYSAYGAGGSGVVIIRMPASEYSGVHTGSPTVTTVGSDVVLQFNSSGSYTI